MKYKLKVYYTVQYAKEIELDLRESLVNVIKNSKGETELYNAAITSEEDQNILRNLPIPTFSSNLKEEVEYVTDSFEINYFKNL